MNEASILLVEDDSDLRYAVSETLSSAGFSVKAVESAELAQVELHLHKPDLVLSDCQMGGMRGEDLLRIIRRLHSNLPVVLMTAYGNVSNAVQAMQDGATDYLQKPFSPQKLLEVVQQYAKSRVQFNNGPVAVDARSVELLQLAKRVAESDATVLLTGPSGVGKEVLARFIHDNSSRKNGPFVAINCAAIPENMLEATLFGYEKGAFTGAHQACAGKFEQAQGGTLLLDEISEMDLSLQAKLLRVLQEREVERLGSRKAVTLNVRVVATSNRTMLEEVKAGRFREDLYFRLNVFPLRCFALAERSADIVPIAEHLIHRHCQSSHRVPPSLSADAIVLLTSYRWPGNVRELENAVQRALIMQSGRELSAQDFQLQLNTDESNNQADEMASIQSARLSDTMRHLEAERIIDALKNTQNTRENIARQLGMSPRTLRYKLARMREMGIAVPQ